jgi:hypothetical protein
MTYGAFMEEVLAVCIKLNCSMTSGMRTEKRNLIVGGMGTSKHIINDAREGWGQDVVPDDRNMNSIVVVEAHRRGLGALDEGNHVHLQWPRAK